MEYMKTLPDNAFDLAIVDPPYGIKCSSVNKNRDPNSKFRRSLAAFVESAKAWNHLKPTQEYFNALFRVSKNQIIWGANNFTLPPTEYFCIWSKQQSVKNFASAEYAWCSPGLKQPALVFDYSIHKTIAVRKANGGKIHPTQKPVALYAWLLKNYSKPGERILDTHLGSGSSAIAAHYFGVDFVGCEINKDYFNAAQQRIKDKTAQLTLF